MMLHDVRNIACGESHVAMLTMEGKIFVCGAGEHGRLGTGNENDRYIIQLSPKIMVIS